MTDVVDRSALRQFLLGLAQGMNASAESVDRIRDTIAEVARASGGDDTDFVVLPTIIIVETGDDEEERVAIRSATNASFRFDQIAALYELIAQARAGTVEPRDGIRRLNEIGAMRPRLGWFTRTLGHAILTTGLALLLAPTWQGAIVAFVLGFGIGLLKLVRSPTLQLIMPIAAAFVCATAVFLLAEAIEIGDPIRLLIAPLVTFLPGGVLTTATVELAAGQMISGASRLIYGFVQLALLAFGILAAGAVVGVSSDSYEPLDASAFLPWWVPLLGILVFALGNFLHFSSPPSTFGWVLLALVVAYLGQWAGTEFIDPAVGGFVGAVAVTPVVFWIAGLRHGAPSQLTFLPAFWLLVPGAAGLVGLTEAFATDNGLADFAAALVSVMSIALGVLIGTALYRVVHHGAEEFVQFAVAPPPVEDTPAPQSLWARLSRPLRRLRRPREG
ncbi:threonine/serine ThrE exporter family protein [Microbacterium paraoxydans]|uniref:Threonine/serine exporter family protein n=1 Tax=Microbacterium paraoxydans TaxID=199592 RepID=A0ABS5IID5_9MICO|nr:threonine/serine exporter family protein [Microbacterium paraoxydans]MBS0022691.1 threonine/serine exporter family protein [Microbacterium paraoxydans]